jgi:S1-C subfamily serine protease
MQDNESAGGGWEQPDPPDHPDQETIAFGYVGYANQVDQGSFGADGYGPTGYGRYGTPGYGGSGTTAYGGSGSTAYAGSGSAGYGGSGPPGYGGSGTAGWGPYAPMPPVRLPPRRKDHMVRYLIAAFLAACLGAGLTAAFGTEDAGSSPRSSPGLAASDIPEPHNIVAGSGSSSSPVNEAAVEAKVKPGLVDIDAVLRYQGESAEGTGMILSPTGLVLTNNHVIDGATSVAVTLAGSRAVYQARVVGYDQSDDVALLQLGGASRLTSVSFGNSAQVSLGTPVLALGNAGGRGGVTPARGVINGLNRSIQASDEGSDTTEDLSHMLETNARIQQGDSGGVLVNNAGQVIGMITAANTGEGPSAGTVGFAIPIDSALAIARQIAAGRASATVYIGTPGFLGVVLAQSDSPDPRRQAFDEQQSARGGRGGRGRPGGHGAACLTPGQPAPAPASIAPVSTGTLILGTLCGTAVAGDGLAPGDVITSVDGQAVTTPDSLTNITARYHPGTVVSVTWEGVNGTRHTTSVRLGSGPAR